MVGLLKLSCLDLRVGPVLGLVLAGERATGGGGLYGGGMIWDICIAPGLPPVVEFVEEGEVKESLLVCTVCFGGGGSPHSNSRALLISISGCGWVP